MGHRRRGKPNRRSWRRNAGRHGRIEASGSHGRRWDGRRWRLGSRGGCLKETWWHGLAFDRDIVLLCLGGKHPFGFVSVALSFAVLLVSVLHADIFIHEKLAVHVVDGIVASLEAAIADKTVSLAQSVIVSGDLGWGDEGSESAECVVENLLVHHGIEVSDEKFGADLEGLLLVRRGLVHA